MMKKKGFTLAEVLITLTIIGVVATLTLPSLITNTQDQQAFTGLKKMVNTLNEIGEMSLAQEDYTYSNAAVLSAVTSSTPIVTDPANAAYMSIGQMFVRHGKLKPTNDTGCLATFLDGTCVVSAGGNGGDIVIDINGGKAPNVAMELNTSGVVTKHGDRFTLSVNTANGNTVVMPGNPNTTRAYEHK